MTQPRNFGFGEDETILRDSARKFLADNASIEALRRLVARDHREAYESAVPPAPWDEGLWQQMVELGWTGLAVPERAGGLGMKMVAVAALAEAAGHAALVSPLITTLLATCVLRECDTAAATAALERIGGGTPMALAVTNARGSWAAEDTDVTATTAADGAVLNGTASFVQDARKVRAFVVAARSDAGVGLYVVDADAPGVSVHPDRIVDLTRDQARVTFADVRVPADRIAAAGNAGATALARRPAGAADDRRRRHVRRRRVAAPDHHRLRPGAQAVRPPARLLPGGQASARQHDARRSIRRARWSTTPPARSTASPTPPSASPAWPRPAPARWPPSAPAGPSSSTAASASPGSATSTSSSSASSTTAPSSATPPTSAPSSPSSSETGSPQRHRDTETSAVVLETRALCACVSLW